MKAIVVQRPQRQSGPERSTGGRRLAPCVAVVGPANSGKTTLLHLLDAGLQVHPEAPLVYVVKGNPDGTGRYLFYAPQLREPLKPRVKGAWTRLTVETIARWVEHCRERLDLVLLDVGGKHSESNRVLFRGCSHFIVVAAPRESPAEEEVEGMESWVRAGRDAGLELVGRVRSLWEEGEPVIAKAPDGTLDASFRADLAGPADTVNRPVVEELVGAALGLRTRHDGPGYLDLRLGRAWTPDDLKDLGGRAEALLERARAGGVVLGGRAPIWAYAAALHRVIEARPAAQVEVFDPKLPSGLVEIPAALAAEPAREAAEALSARWGRAPGGQGGALDLEITTEDRFLPIDFTSHLPALPRPAGEPPSGPVVVSGAAPIWLHLAYSRWLRTVHGVTQIGHADAGTGRAFLVAGPGTPTTRPWRLA